MPSFELLLPLGAMAFCLYDSALLLFGNELVLEHGRAFWRVSGGSDLMLAGRRVYLPNPLRPYLALYRICWSADDQRLADPNPEALETFERALRPVQWLVAALAAMLWLLLPAISWTIGAGWPLLAVFAGFYFLVLVGLAVIFPRRAALGLDSRGFWMLALDVLACAPFAVNLVRKLALRRRFGGNPLLSVTTQLDAAALHRLVDIVARRVDDDLVHEPGTQRGHELQSFLRRVRELAS